MNEAGDTVEMQGARQERGKDSYIKEVIELVNFGGWAKLTPEELKWVRPPEVITEPSRINQTPEQLAEIRGVCRREALTMVSPGHMPGFAYEPIRLAAVFTDKEEEGEKCSILPPASEVQSFIDFVAEHEGPVDVGGQFEKLVELSGGSVLDAALIGMMASRIVARNLDKTAYPEVGVREELRDKWHNNLLPFERTEKPQDKLGDNYYFWTSVYTALALKNTDSSWFASVMDAHSAKIMSLSRRYLANQPTITDHSKAFDMGKSVARFLCEYMVDAKGENEQADPKSKKLRTEHLKGTNVERRVDAISWVVENLGVGEEMVLEGGSKEFESGFDLVEYFSALPVVGAMHRRRGKDWRDILNEVRQRTPAVKIGVCDQGVKIRREKGGRYLEFTDTDTQGWLNGRLEKITNSEARKLAEIWIIMGTSNLDSARVRYQGDSIEKNREHFVFLLHNSEERRKIFDDEAWQALTEILCACVDAGVGFVDETTGGQHRTVFMKAREDLALSVLIFPDDGLNPRIDVNLLGAVNNFDPTLASDEDKLKSFANALSSRSWFSIHEDELGKLEPQTWRVAVLLLRQNIFEILGESGESRRKAVIKVLDERLELATKGRGGERDRAREELEIIYSLGMDYETDPVVTALATLHDPSLYATARYYLDNGGVAKAISRAIRNTGQERSISYAREISDLMKKRPDQLLGHQQSLSRRLSCPSCYGYAAGLELQKMIQGGNINEVETGGEGEARFAQQMFGWASSKS